MRAIQPQLPSPKHVEIHRSFVHAPPDAAWAAARHFDGSKIPWVRALFDVRTLPGRLAGGVREPDRGLGIDDITAESTGFSILSERAGEEVVVGAIGRFWHVDIPFQHLPPEDFARFAEPGWGKVAWSIHVEPYQTGSMITLELRTTATDEESWHKLRRYFRVIGPASRMIRRSMMGHLEAQLGPMPRPEDKTRALAGDELIRDARYSFTHAVDVEAPPSMVWPWLMQMGCDRGGWYSVDALDHGGVPSTERLVPEWSSRAVGEIVPAAPNQEGGFEVLAVEPPLRFSLGTEADRLGGHIQGSWTFVLEPLGEDATHLVTRVRARGTPRWAEWFQGAVLYRPVHAFMQHAQLANLKRIVEGTAWARGEK